MQSLWVGTDAVGTARDRPTSGVWKKIVGFLVGSRALAGVRHMALLPLWRGVMVYEEFPHEEKMGFTD